MDQFNFPKEEEKILAFWQKNKIFEKSLSERKAGKNFSFYDGPPFATGKPHYGHILASALKDTTTRFYAARGFYVPRKVGWDCHGLPVENLVEKELGIKNKKEIEKLGIAKFNQACESAVTRHIDDFTKVLKRFGRWADWQHPYYTMDKAYSESVWWVFKQLDEAGLVYEDKRVSAYCPHCGTPLANFEVNQGYKEVVDNSIYVLFRLKSEKDTYFLAWTTTPWTLSANLALAIGDFEYVKVKIDDKFIILARERLKVLTDQYEIVETYQPKQLIGSEYEPLYPESQKLYAGGDLKNAFKIYQADFVNIEDGSGIVHIAPSFGEDDMHLGKKNKLGMLITVDKEGKSLVDPGQGLWVKEADKLVIKDLRDRGILYKEEIIKHPYPFCWRCDTALLYYPIKTYYVRVSSLVDKLVKNNNQVHWVPEYIKQGRFGNWIAEARDWSVSRNRYWGAPIPVWKCDHCDHQETLGSVAELEEKSRQKINDLHRPFIDQVEYSCPKCQGKMKRTSEVFDCWFESGSMPYASFHYPFENKEKTQDNFPADFIAEGLDMTRGWFYTLHVLATALTQKDLGLGFDQPAFKNVVVNGIILAEDGKKLSKHLKNYPDPQEVFNNFGADPLRFFLISSAPLGENYRMSERLIKLTYQNVILRLYNSYQFLDYYQKLYNISAVAEFDSSKVKKLEFLDQWILERLDGLYAEVIKQMEDYQLVKAAKAIDSFVADLSLWYIRRLKSQINSKDEAEKRLSVYKYVLKEFTIIAAPFLPFLSEYLYKNLRSKTDPISVHLVDIKNPKNLGTETLHKMEQIREIISKLLDLRNQNGFKVRQPLASATISIELNKDEAQIIKDELNVKNVQIAQAGATITANGGTQTLDFNLTPELKEEGLLREAIRNFQDLRKTQGYKFGEPVKFLIKTDQATQKFLEKYQLNLQKTTNIELKFAEGSEEISRFKLGDQEIVVFKS
jgi:isoleucyl-tRNA synthetase